MRKQHFLTLAIVIFAAVILSSCSFHQKPAASLATVTATPIEENTAAASEAVTEELEPTIVKPEPTATPTTKPTVLPSPTITPIPTITNTPLPTTTNTPLPVILPEKSSITGERMPKGEPQDAWRGIPIPEEAITGQEKKTSWGERYYVFTIQSDVAALQELLTQSLIPLGWTSTEGGKGEEVALAFFTKGGKLLRFEFFIEDEDEDLLLVKIFKR